MAGIGVAVACDILIKFRIFIFFLVKYLIREYGFRNKIVLRGAGIFDVVDGTQVVAVILGVQLDVFIHHCVQNDHPFQGELSGF